MRTMRLLAVAAAAAHAAAGRTVHLSNVALPVDTDGRKLLTGEASVLSYGGYWYFYFNNWGGCAGVDCCGTEGGCSGCCFKGPDDPCVYTNNHTVEVYRTADLTTWEHVGEALPTSAFVPGVEFRPCVVRNAATGKFVMWYEDRHAGQEGYAVAVSNVPEGPFVTVRNSTKMHGKGRSDGSGDFNILVDDDGAAYHVRDGFVIEKLTADYTEGTGEVAELKTPKESEGPVFFKRNGTYYILPGTSCCACKGGSSVYVFTSDSPLGPYTFRGDVGSNTSQPFDKHSATNFVTHAQASSVFEVAAPDGTVQYVWMGNQWVTSQEPGRPRNHDLLYFAVLEFGSDGSVLQLRRTSSAELAI